MKNDVYKKVTNQIIELLEKGDLNWIKSWKSGFPKNFVSKKDYRGINSLLLNWHLQKNNFTQPYYLTFKQVKDAGGSVIKGSKGEFIIFYKLREIKKEVVDEKTGNNEEKIKKIPLIRGYYVFNIEQTTLKVPVETKVKFDRIEACECIIEGYKDKPEIRFNGGRAYYNVTEDFISVPQKHLFESEEGFYSTLFHEMVHSTGGANRLKRGWEGDNVFGSSDYSKEELIAEIGCCFLCCKSGIDFKTLKNSAGYIAFWLKNLREDKRFIFRVVSQSQKACDYIFGIKNKAVK